MNFYQNPPKTHSEIVEYLTSWLEVVPESSRVYLYDNTEWKQTHGFTRAFHIHAVFKNDADQYCFHVQDKNETVNESFIPNMGVYKDWDSMIQGVATLYCKSWNIVR